jgi:hypothetical protein
MPLAYSSRRFVMVEPMRWRIPEHDGGLRPIDQSLSLARHDSAQSSSGRKNRRLGTSMAPARR